MAAFGLLRASAAAQTRPMPAGFRIDVHHHLAPPSFIAMVDPRALFPGLAQWTPERSFADMDAAGVATAILSMPRTPYVYTGPPDKARSLARQFNEYMAGLKQRFPQRFSFWADVPLPDVEGSVREAAYALDTLGADGIAVATSYGTTWLGDAAYEPLWAELDRRRALVFAHPLSNTCCTNQVPGVMDTTIEYGTDTTRTIASLLFSGMAERYPGVRFVFAHAGGTMPFLIDRFRFQARDPKSAAAVPNGVDAVVRRFYYETAQSATREAIGALTALVPSSHVLFGSDFPYRRAAEDVDGLRGCGLSAAQLNAIGRDNFLALRAHLG